jgi:hypothetical protein
MRRRRLLVGAGTLALLGLAVLPVFWLPVLQRHRVNRESFKYVRAGMTEQELGAILGGPAGNYTTGPVHLYSVKQILDPPSGAICKEWHGDDGSLTVWLNEGRVVLVHVIPGFPTGERPWDRLRRWLGW